MALPARPSRMTEAEYLAFEAASETRHEFWDGRVIPVHGYDETGVVAMAGASPDHNLINANLTAVLVPQLRARGCRPGLGDQRVRVPSGRYVYADFVATCGEPRYTDDNPAVLLNPTLVVEILSPSTADRDRGEKLAAYTAIESLQAYWIVEPGRPLVTLVERDAEGWRLRFARGLDAVLASEALTLAVPLAELYALVAFPADLDPL